MGNQLDCHRCGDVITEWCETRRYGFWDPDAQNYESHGGITQHYCRECWNDQEGRANGAHFRPDSAEQLYDILETADGGLAATLLWWSGRPSIRVVDGAVEAAVTKPERGDPKPDGTPVVKFEVKRIEDYDKEQFLEDADPPDGERDVVLLKDPEQTSFAGLDE